MLRADLILHTLYYSLSRYFGDQAKEWLAKGKRARLGLRLSDVWTPHGDWKSNSTVYGTYRSTNYGGAVSLRSIVVSSHAVRCNLSGFV